MGGDWQNFCQMGGPPSPPQEKNPVHYPNMDSPDSLPPNRGPGILHLQSATLPHMQKYNEKRSLPLSSNCGCPLLAAYVFLLHKRGLKVRGENKWETGAVWLPETLKWPLVPSNFSYQGTLY